MLRRGCHHYLIIVSDILDRLFPILPLSRRARAVKLEQKGQALQGWLAHTVTADLGIDEVVETHFNQSEFGQASTFRFAPRREDFFLGRLAAKLALSASLGESDASSISVSNGVLGQPSVCYARPHSTEVTLTHSLGQAIALAFPQGCPMGIDLEAITEDRVKTMREELVLSRQEHQWVHSGSMDPGALRVVLWTAREALGKVLRCGLGCPPETFALEDLTSSGQEGGWVGNYGTFRQYKCLSWVGSQRVFTIALPKVVDLSF